MTSRNLAMLFLSIPVALSLWAFWIEPASLRNEDHAIVLPAWPKECNGIRIAILTDLHVGSPYNGLSKLSEIVNLTQKARPDLILLAGDYVIHEIVGGKFVAPEEMAPLLGRLAAPMGVYAVLGNHDWWFDGPRMRKALESVGISVLEDAATVITKGSCNLWLTGVSDYLKRRHDVRAALHDVPESAPVIVFTHNPDVFPHIPSRVLLTIAGHTHGGQVYLPGIGRPIVPSRYGQRFAVGHIVEEGRHLFVSSGLGTSLIPVRFLVPPEVSILNVSRSMPDG